jgi:hypothetical protein
MFQTNFTECHLSVDVVYVCICRSKNHSMRQDERHANIPTK